ncbi:hypothetical protein HCBG_07296 [Histoplasma capsulatum G186AR]|uniref:Uncharacterized protein n=1 Tax=Ajellomyces capsulatus (strain G186AR / H82 / ATCC MYA-2454 / RMSCC 2432) TaxID=447093 RepID=C0NVW6_AJECG|nr:uncharacterized protein HCBG_07296 [Histoplasma capsulatum G186AR]EEH04655.1 hypothetical protein HCBG_07296 [Histoplasma capsulatum G186AR]
MNPSRTGGATYSHGKKCDVQGQDVGLWLQYVPEIVRKEKRKEKKKEEEKGPLNKASNENAGWFLADGKGPEVSYGRPLHGFITK